MCLPVPLQPGDRAPVWDQHPDPPVLRAAAVSFSPGGRALPVGVLRMLPGPPAKRFTATCPIVFAPVADSSQVHLFAYLETSAQQRLQRIGQSQFKF